MPARPVPDAVASPPRTVVTLLLFPSTLGFPAPSPAGGRNGPRKGGELPA